MSHVNAQYGRRMQEVACRHLEEIAAGMAGWHNRPIPRAVWTLDFDYGRNRMMKCDCIADTASPNSWAMCQFGILRKSLIPSL